MEIEQLRAVLTKYKVDEFLNEYELIMLMIEVLEL